MPDARSEIDSVRNLEPGLAGNTGIAGGRRRLDSASPEVAELYEEYSDQLTRTLQKVFGSGPPDPEDISHLAFQKIMERGDTASIRCLKSFLWRTACNLLFKEKRREETRLRYGSEIEHLFSACAADAPEPERTLISREKIFLINEALEKMPENRRSAFLLYRFEGLSYTEIGRRLGMSRPAAAKHIAKAISEIDGLFDANADKFDV